MRRLLFFLLLLPFIVSSCDFFGERVRGNGDIKSETRPAGGFNSVDVSGNIELHVTQDTSCSVRIETDQNLMQFIEVRTDDDVLRIHPREHYNLDPTHKITAYVSAPEFRHLEASGACAVYSDTKISSDQELKVNLSGASTAKLDIKAPSVDADLSGACNISMKGETKDLHIGGSGASEIKCFDLMAENVDVDLSGAGNAEVFASVKLKGEASGAGNIKYKGDAAVELHTSGAGSVRKVD